MIVKKILVHDFGAGTSFNGVWKWWQVRRKVIVFRTMIPGMTAGSSISSARRKAWLIGETTKGEAIVRKCNFRDSNARVHVSSYSLHTAPVGSCTNPGLMHTGNHSMEDIVSTFHLSSSYYFRGREWISLEKSKTTSMTDRLACY